MTYVGVILLKDGALLLGRRAQHRSYPDCWDLIGGHVEPGETLEEGTGVTPVQFAKLPLLRAGA